MAFSSLSEEDEGGVEFIKASIKKRDLSEGPLYMYLLSFTTVRKKKTRTAACEDIYNNL